MKTHLRYVFLAFLFAVANAGASVLARSHCEGIPLLAFAGDTEDILAQNGLTAGAYVPVRRGPTLPYPETSLLHGNRYSRESYVPVTGVDAADAIVQSLAPRAPARAAEIRKYIAEAQRRGLRELPLTDFFPKEIRETGFVDCDGPNCFNTAARFHNPHLPRGEMEPPDKIKLLQADYVQLAPGEKLEPGDELVIWMPPSDPRERPYRVAQIDSANQLWQGRILHAMIYIDPWTVYHKASALRDSPIGFEQISSAMRMYLTWEPVVTVHRKKPVAPAPDIAGPRLILAR